MSGNFGIAFDGYKKVSSATPMPVTGGDISTTTATIASTASLSDAVDCSTPATRARRLVLPSNMRGITRLSAAECNTSGGTFTPVADEDGSEWYVDVVASLSVPLPARVFDTCNYVKFRGGTSGSTQSASGGDLVLTVYKG